MILIDKYRINNTFYTNYNYFNKLLNAFKYPQPKWQYKRNWKAFYDVNSLFMFSTKNYFVFVFFKFYYKCKMDVLSDIYVVDYILNLYRFQITYNLISVNRNNRIFVKFFSKIFESMFSLYNLYNSSVWLEREIWDMFGIFFVGNLDLRRILTDYGFIGFPLRKNFPLLGFFELRFDYFKKSVMLSNIELTQEFRTFDNDLSWL